MAETAETSTDTSRPGSTLLTFLIADVRGYTRFTNEHGDEAAARLADRFAGFCEEILGAHDGQVIELRGDEALAVFSSARNALRGAVALQQAFKSFVADDPSLPLNVGMGLDAGEPIAVRGGYRGGALNLAARLCSIAGPGEILASEGVIHLARKTEGLAFIDRGQVTLKGLVALVRVIQIAPEGELPAEMPPLQPVLVTHPTNLPDEPTPFIGREDEIARISALVRDPHIRLVTLTGPGGTGKTRLALQVGNTVLYDFQDGVFFCDLSTLADAALVPSALARVLDVQEEAGRELTDTLVAHLQDKHLLLVLDNFEHLLDASAIAADLLEECRHLRILVTSRTSLHLSREREHAVPPLSVPEPGQVRDASSLAHYEATALFLERARAVKDTFAVTDESARAVAEICSRLEGLPLAIELAAARIKLFPPQALLQRLSSRLTLLTGGPRDRPTRHQTLRGAIDWSYSLLSEEEQTLIARLSVFAGGWSFEAAEAVCNAKGDLDLLEGMASLADKSLIQREGEEEPRFIMLETIREYAAEALSRSAHGGEAARLHADHFLRTAGQVASEKPGPREVTLLVDLERDLDNYRAALTWLLAHGRASDALTLASALSGLWYARGWLQEGRHWIMEGLRHVDERDASTRADGLVTLSSIVRFQGDFLEAARLAEESLTLFRDTDNRRGIARALRALGCTLMFAEEYGRCRAYLEESVAYWRDLGDPVGLVTALTNLGDSLVRAGSYELARVPLLESVNLGRALESPSMAGYPLYKLGVAALEQGDLDAARLLLAESGLLARGNREGEIMTLQFAAAVAAAEGSPAQCAQLLGSAEAFAEQLGSFRLGTDRGRNEQRYFARARAELGEEAWEEARSAGREMSPEEAFLSAVESKGSGREEP